MSGFSDVDLSNLPAPDAVEKVDYEATLEERKAGFQDRYPDHTALGLESDPTTKLLEESAYRETIIRQKINDGVRAVMLATATGADLDNLGAFYGVTRHVLDPGDPDALPPVAPVYESDDDYRRRIQLAPEAMTNAGSDGAYIFHCLSVSRVKDAYPDSPAPVEVVLHILSREGDGVPDSTVLDAVFAAVGKDRKVRPLTDRVTVQAAGKVEFSIAGSLAIQSGPDAQAVLDAALVSLNAYLETTRRLGAEVSLSAIHAALHVEGVTSVELTEPAASIKPELHQAAICTGVAIVEAGA